MFKKLFKHELKSYVRTLIPIYIAITGMALLCRIIQIFEADTVAYKLLFGSSVATYYFVICAATILVAILCIVRFYKNLFTGEGYLTFTLPVSVTCHLWVKLLCATLVEIMTIAVSIASLAVFFETEVLIEIFKAIAYLAKLAIGEVGISFFVFIIELLTLLIITSVSGTLLIYACICLGQRAKKARIGLAVGVYFIHYFITQTLSSVFSITISILGAAGALDGVIIFIENNPITSVHIGFAISLVVTVGLSVLYYFISLRTMKNKLNLE